MKIKKKNIFAIPGSIRTNSSNWKIMEAISGLYSEQLNVEIYNQIDRLPHFNADIEKERIPPIVRSFLEKINKADGVIICTPEYVFSLPAILKNALEWTVSETIFSYKPVAFIVASGLGEKTFESLDLIMKTLVQTEIADESKLLIQGARSKINKTGQISDTKTMDEVKNLVASLICAIEKEKPLV